MKSWINISLAVSLCVLYIEAAPATDQSKIISVNDVCSMLDSISKEGEMFARFNGVFFGDFRSGKDLVSKGSLAVGGSFTGENAFINQDDSSSCSTAPLSRYAHHGLILKGAINSPIKVNGHAYVPQTNSNKVSVPAKACSVRLMDAKQPTPYEFDQSREEALNISRRLAGMLPNWSINQMGVIVKMIPEGVQVEQPFSLFEMPVYCSNAAKCQNIKSYFDCSTTEECITPNEALSEASKALFLGADGGNWKGPMDQIYPKDKMVVFNIPVLEGDTFDLQTKNPSIGLNACNTIYNFYAVNQDGRFNAKGKFTIKRAAGTKLEGMVLAPQAHIIDNAAGAFTGQIVADSYEAIGNGVQILGYKQASNDGHTKCEAFLACSNIDNKLTEEKSAERKQQDLKLLRRQPVNIASVSSSTASASLVISATHNRPSSSPIIDDITTFMRGPWYRHKIKHWLHQWDSGKNSYYGDKYGYGNNDWESKKKIGSWEDKKENDEEWNYSKDGDDYGENEEDEEDEDEDSKWNKSYKYEKVNGNEWKGSKEGWKNEKDYRGEGWDQNERKYKGADEKVFNFGGKKSGKKTGSSL